MSYKGTDMYEYAEQAWSTMSHSGLLIKYNPMPAPCIYRNKRKIGFDIKQRGNFHSGIFRLLDNSQRTDYKDKVQ